MSKKASKRKAATISPEAAGYLRPTPEIAAPIGADAHFAVHTQFLENLCADRTLSVRAYRQVLKDLIDEIEIYIEAADQDLERQS